MAENKKGGVPRGPYFDGKAHFSYNKDLVYHPHQFKAHETVQGMVQRAEQSMAENQFKS
jgi:hypothetical protein